MRNIRGLTLLASSALLLSGCNKSTSATADSAATSRTPSSNINEREASAQILAADSAFVRGITTNHVDSMMAYYDPSVVSLGKTAVNGTTDLRKSYEQAVKNPPRDVNFQSGGVRFSDDHSVAWDWGTVSQTVSLNGKPVKTSGTYLNVWKNVGGRWMIVAEISSVTP